jgi:hypothetical protein
MLQCVLITDTVNAELDNSLLLLIQVPVLIPTKLLAVKVLW